MDYCNECECTIVWTCHILRVNSINNSLHIEGHGRFCCPGCALGYLTKNNHGDSDYYNCYALICVKYGNNDGQIFSPFVKDDNFNIHYKPDYVVDAFTEEEEYEEDISTKKYNVKKKGVMGSVNKAIGRFFEGKEKAVITAANTCPTK